MAKTLIRLNFVLLLLLASCSTSRKVITADEFKMAFSQANVQVRGELKRYGEYHSDLSTLTYKEYLKTLKEVDNKSKKNITMIVKRAEPYYFVAKPNTFQVVIFCKELNLLIYDDANTSLADCTIIIKENSVLPDLKSLIR